MNAGPNEERDAIRDAVRDALRAEDAAGFERRVDVLVEQKIAAREAEEAAAAETKRKRQWREQRAVLEGQLRDEVIGVQRDVIEVGAARLAKIESLTTQIISFTELNEQRTVREDLQRGALELMPAVLFHWQAFSGVAGAGGLLELLPRWRESTNWPRRWFGRETKVPAAKPDENFSEPGAA